MRFDKMYEKIMENHVIRLGACLVLCLLLLLFIRLAGDQGKAMAIKSEHNFTKTVMHKELTVVLFYQKDKMSMKCDPTAACALGRLQDLFIEMSKVSAYKEAGVYFLMVNTARNDLSSLLCDYQINQLPVVLLFKDGVPVRVKNSDMRAMLPADDLSCGDLRTFIDDNFSSRIGHILEDKAEARRQAAEDRFYNAPYYAGWGAYPYYYWNAPYYGYGGPWWW